MINGIFSALSGLRTSAQQLQNNSNNLANLGTSGFKKNTVTTSEVRSGGSQLTSIIRVNTQGGILSTNNPTDERSNVDIVEEVVEQISTQAAFTSNAKVIGRTDKIIGSILNIKS